jgi:hypothetical protein
MTISTTTGGPVDPSPELPATFGGMANDIADDVDDTTGEYASAIRKSILAAIRYCDANTYYFNESRDITFSTVQGQDWYNASDNVNIPTLVHIENVWSEDSNGQRYVVSRSLEADMELVSDNSASTGRPYAWSYFNQMIRLYPIPDANVYTIRVVTGPYKLQTLVNDTDSNAWMSEAYDMIKARAKYILAKNTLKDANMATEALNDFTDQERSVSAETSKRLSTGLIIATAF